MNRLRMLRKERNLTLVDLANLIHINKTSIARYETREVEMKADTLQIFANFFNVSTDYLLGKTDERLPSSSSPKDQLKGVKLALFDQVEDLTDDQAKQVLDIIKIIKKE